MHTRTQNKVFKPQPKMTSSEWTNGAANPL